MDEGFDAAQNAEQRYFACFYALETARGRQKSLLNNKPILVSKSPNNELFMFSWERMLSNKVKFVWCVRNPFEHYLSILNTTDKVGQKNMSVEQFCQWVRGRNDLMPQANNNLFILRYEDLTDNTQTTIEALAGFIGISFQPGLLHPTKNGTAWSGNSSRGIVRQGIYHNPATEKKQPTSGCIATIQSELDAVLKRFNYQL